MSKTKALSMEDENFKKAIEVNRQLPFVEGSLDTLVNELADEIIYLYDTTQNYKREPILSRIFTIPIYLGEDLNYLCCVRFLLEKINVVYSPDFLYNINSNTPIVLTLYDIFRRKES